MYNISRFKNRLVGLVERKSRDNKKEDLIMEEH